MQTVEEMNDKVKSGEISLEGVVLVSLDVEAMYNNMSKDLGTGACREYLEGRAFQKDGDYCSVSSESILAALDLCLSLMKSFTSKLLV